MLRDKASANGSDKPTQLPEDYGPQVDLFPLLGSRIKSALMGATPDAVARFFTGSCRMGGFLVSILRSAKSV